MESALEEKSELLLLHTTSSLNLYSSIDSVTRLREIRSVSALEEFLCGTVTPWTNAQFEENETMKVVVKSLLEMAKCVETKLVKVLDREVKKMMKQELFKREFENQVVEEMKKIPGNAAFEQGYRLALWVLDLMAEKLQSAFYAPHARLLDIVCVAASKSVKYEKLYDLVRKFMKKHVHLHVLEYLKCVSIERFEIPRILFEYTLECDSEIKTKIISAGNDWFSQYSNSSNYDLVSFYLSAYVNIGAPTQLVTRILKRSPEIVLPWLNQHAALLHSNSLDVLPILISLLDAGSEPAIVKLVSAVNEAMRSDVSKILISSFSAKCTNAVKLGILASLHSLVAIDPKKDLLKIRDAVYSWISKETNITILRPMYRLVFLDVSKAGTVALVEGAMMMELLLLVKGNAEFTPLLKGVTESLLDGISNRTNFFVALTLFLMKPDAILLAKGKAAPLPPWEKYSNSAHFAGSFSKSEIDEVEAVWNLAFILCERSEQLKGLCNILLVSLVGTPSNSRKRASELLESLLMTKHAAFISSSLLSGFNQVISLAPRNILVSLLHRLTQFLPTPITIPVFTSLVTITHSPSLIPPTSTYVGVHTLSAQFSTKRSLWSLIVKHLSLQKDFAKSLIELLLKDGADHQPLVFGTLCLLDSDCLPYSIEILTKLLCDVISFFESLSAFDILVFNSPVGVLVENVKEVVEKPKKKGKKTKEEEEEEEWERKQEEKRKKSGKDPVYVKQIALQSTLRENISKKLTELTRLLDIFHSILSCTHFSSSVLASINQILTKLTTPFTTLNIPRCSLVPFLPAIQGIFSHVAARLPCVDKQAELVGLLVYLSMKGEDLYSSGARVDILTSTIRILQVELEKKQVFPAHTFNFIWPIFKCVAARAVKLGEQTPGFKEVFEIISAHCTAQKDDDYPLSSMCEVFFSLYAIPSFKENVQQNLQSIAPYIHAADVKIVELFINELLGDLKVELTLHTLYAMRFHELDSRLLCVLWMVCHSQDAARAHLAQKVWKQFDLSPPNDNLILLEYAVGSNTSVRAMAASAIASAQNMNSDMNVLDRLVNDLISKFIASPDTIISSDFRREAVSISQAHVRLGVGAVFSALISRKLLSGLHVTLIMSFLLNHGLIDVDSSVWEFMLKVGLDLIESFGEKQVNSLLQLLESCLERKDTNIVDMNIADKKHEGVVILTGQVARFLTDSVKIEKIVLLLLEVLHVPSHAVQMAVSGCLEHLILSCSEVNQKSYIDKLLHELTTNEKYGSRKGASLGLAGCIKGLRISSLKKFNIMTTLQLYSADSKSSMKRQGALFAYESLFVMLESKFEPYISVILPFLLSSFGDSSVDVRDATQDASRVIMSNLTAHGIRLVLPVVLKALEESTHWRPKVEAIGILGTMAYCAPKQLSSCLPQLVPRLLEIMADPHVKVLECARNALTGIGAVIQNPEIQSIVPNLLAALIDNVPPVQQKALDSLVQTSFVHSMDAASLAIIMPILRRALKGRTTILKKMSAQVAGSMCSLVGSPKDLLPYSNELLQDFKLLIVDPIPEVRAHAAKALGQLYKGLQFGDLLSWLMNSLSKDETTGVERNGFAQALSEVIFNAGKLEEMLSDIMLHCKSSRSNVREGFTSLFIYLPKAFGENFGCHIPVVLPLVMSSFSDDVEPVRDVSLRAGQVLVYMFSRSHTNILLPLLESGMYNFNWRIRDCCVRLLGDFLHRLAGQKSVINYDEEDETVAASDIRVTLESVLGKDVFEGILSILYIARFDVTPIIKQTAWRVWKSVINNTPKVLRDMLPILMDRLVESLAAKHADRQTAAGRALGELVSKMGEVVLPVIVPYITKSLKSPSAHARQGVALGLGELLRSVSKIHIGAYMLELYPAMQLALCDINLDVREAAAFAFSVLFKNIGQKAIEEVVPTLVKLLFEKARNGDLEEELLAIETEFSEADSKEESDEESDGESDIEEFGSDEDSEASESEIEQEPGNVSHSKRHISDDAAPNKMFVLEGVRQIIEIAPAYAMPYLIPPLLTPPITSINAKILSTLASVFGENVNSYLSDIVKFFIKTIAECNNESEAEEIFNCCEEFSLSAVSESGLNTFITSLIEIMDNAGPRAIVLDGRVASWCAKLVKSFCGNTDLDLESFVPFLLNSLIKLFNAEFEITQDAALDAVESIIETIPKDSQSKLIVSVRNWISTVITDPNTRRQYISSLPAFSRPKSFAPLWPMLQQGLLYGSAVERTHAAKALGELIALTPVDALKGLTAKVTGPLIRIVGDRFPPAVKCAILKTLTLLIEKSGKNLKQFLPPLQTAFVKTLYADSQAVRVDGARALASLLQLQPKVEPLLNEIVTSIRTKTETDMRASLFDALRVLLFEINASKAAVSLQLATTMKDLALEYAASHEDIVRIAASRSIGQICIVLTNDEFDHLITMYVLDMPDLGRLKHAHGEALSSMITCAGEKCLPYLDKIYNFCADLAVDETPSVREIGSLCCYNFIRQYSSKVPCDNSLKVLIGLGNDDSADIRNISIKRLATLCRYLPEWTSVFSRLDLLLRFAISRLADSTSPVKHAAKHLIFYALQFKINSNDSKLLQTYIRASNNDEDVRFLYDYSRKVFVQFQPDLSVTELEVQDVTEADEEVVIND